MAKYNTCAKLEPLSIEGDGWYTWTDADVAKFVKRWPLGTKPYLAFALLRYTMVRRSDVVQLGKPNINSDGNLAWVEAKGSRSKVLRNSRKPRVMKIAPQLLEAITATEG